VAAVKKTLVLGRERERGECCTMARVLRGVPSRKILVKKPVVTRERRMGVDVDGKRRGERESTRSLMRSL